MVAVKSVYKYRLHKLHKLRGRAEVARQAHNLEVVWFESHSRNKLRKHTAIFFKHLIFFVLKLLKQLFSVKNGAFVYRLGHKIFILGRWVRLPYALQSHSHKVNLGLKYNRVLLGKILMDRGGCRLSSDSLIPVHGFKKRSFKFSQHQ